MVTGFFCIYSFYDAGLLAMAFSHVNVNTFNLFDRNVL